VLFASLDTLASGLTAQRLQMDVISNNLANAQTTTTPGGGPFREQLVQMTAIPLQSNGAGGVVVTGIVGNAAPFPLRYDPASPQANAQGYVQMPNVSSTAQMVDLMAASRAYDANATAFSDVVKDQQSALQI
jgi:flagellar basal-body rod protein FlgC